MRSISRDFFFNKGKSDYLWQRAADAESLIHPQNVTKLFQNLIKKDIDIKCQVWYKVVRTKDRAQNQTKTTWSAAEQNKAKMNRTGQ